MATAKAVRNVKRDNARLNAAVSVAMQEIRDAAGGADRIFPDLGEQLGIEALEARDYALAAAAYSLASLASLGHNRSSRYDSLNYRCGVIYLDALAMGGEVAGPDVRAVLLANVRARMA